MTTHSNSSKVHTLSPSARARHARTYMRGQLKAKIQRQSGGCRASSTTLQQPHLSQPTPYQGFSPPSDTVLNISQFGSGTCDPTTATASSSNLCSQDVRRSFPYHFSPLSLSELRPMEGMRAGARPQSRSPPSAGYITASSSPPLSSSSSSSSGSSPTQETDGICCPASDSSPAQEAHGVSSPNSSSDSSSTDEKGGVLSPALSPTPDAEPGHLRALSAEFHPGPDGSDSRTTAFTMANTSSIRSPYPKQASSSSNRRNQADDPPPQNLLGGVCVSPSPMTDMALAPRGRASAHPSAVTQDSFPEDIINQLAANVLEIEAKHHQIGCHLVEVLDLVEDLVLLDKQKRELTSQFWTNGMDLRSQIHLSHILRSLRVASRRSYPREPMARSLPLYTDEDIKKIGRDFSTDSSTLSSALKERWFS